MGKVLLQEDGIEAYLWRKVPPDAPSAWYKPKTVRVDYKISFVLYLCKSTPRRSLDETRADTLALQPEMDGLLADLLHQRKRLTRMRE